MGTLRFDVLISDVDRAKVPGTVDRVKMALSAIVPKADIEVRYDEKIEPPKEG